MAWGIQTALSNSNPVAAGGTAFKPPLRAQSLLGEFTSALANDAVQAAEAQCCRRFPMKAGGGRQIAHAILTDKSHGFGRGDPSGIRRHNVAAVCVHEIASVRIDQGVGVIVVAIL